LGGKRSIDEAGVAADHSVTVAAKMLWLLSGSGSGS
jgi:hypothetical protein